MKRADAIRYHLEEAAALTRAAETATSPDAHDELLTLAHEHEGLADAARHGEYPTDELED
ncbi:hypothetical protein ACWDD9_31755 [Kitasatospora sp. NPDC001119]